MTVTTLHAEPLPVKGVDDDANDDAKEAGFDEERKAPQVQRLHVESRNSRLAPVTCCRH